MKGRLLTTILFIYFCFLNSQSAHAQVGTLPLNSNVIANVTGSTGDTWNVTTTGDGLLRLTLTTTSPADLYMSLYDNNGTTLLGGQVESYNNSTVTLSTDGLAPGTYVVKVIPFSTSFGTYNLADSLFTSTLGNDAEPNGNVGSAIVLPLNNSITGHVGYYYNQLRDTADWYKVTTDADGLFKVVLSTQRGSVYSINPLDVNITLYDNDGTTQLGAVEVFNANNPATGIITTDGLAPGTYYIKVQPYSTTEFANYTLSDTLITASLGNDAEPNGNAGSAIGLPLNNGMTGHLGYYYNKSRDTADWYKVTTDANGLLKVVLSTQRGSVYSGNPLDVNVTLYDNNATTQLGAVEVFNANNPATGVITTDGLAPGTYYIKVQPYSTAEFSNYTLSDTLILNPFKTDVEPNGSRTTAQILPLNASDTGQVGYYYNGGRDTADWYKVTTNADGLLRVYLTTSRGSIYSNNPLDVNVTLFDNDATTQLGAVEVFNSNNPATGIITTDGLAPGTYYIRLQPFSTNEFANYILTDSLFLPPVSADAEPNGTAVSAIQFPLNSNINGHIGYYYNNQRDTADWYKITLPADGPLHLYLNMLRGGVFSNNPLDMIMTFYNVDGTTQLGSKEVFHSNGPGIDSLSFAFLAAGDYYVKVINFSTAEFGNYSLTNTVSATAGSLPVSYIYFGGVLKNGQAFLNWKTAIEINNKGFEIERSADGYSFTGIGFVNGYGNSSGVSEYTFSDANPPNGAAYYRLKQIDLDGKIIYSFSIRLDYNVFDWKISGNPVTTHSWLQLNLGMQAHISIRVSNMDGKILQNTDKGLMAEGAHVIPIDLSALAHGTYIITLINGTETLSKLIVR